ncbi:sigma-70 family RNA polymerase sigma factor [Candidatus Woesearchaeota archaeon]|nr:sigma-70 family RNA polymerase sigma factor [Candidatus Woesearchaeota archaeon]
MRNKSYLDDAKPGFERDSLTHLDALYNFAMSLERHPARADDLVQETYFRAFKFQHRFQPGTNMGAWLFQIMMNTSFTFYRLREREAATAEDGVPDWDIPMFHDAPYEDSRALEDSIDIARAMRRLPEDFRTAILLREGEGMQIEEIARVISCPVGTVRSRIFRAKERLWALLRDYWLEPYGNHRTPATRTYSEVPREIFDSKSANL